MITADYVLSPFFSSDTSSSSFPGVCPSFKVTGMIEWGLKLKPKKISGRNINPQKPCAKFLSLNFRDTLALPQIFRLFELIPKKILSKVNPPKKCFPILPKKFPESKISNPEKSFDHPYHLKSGVPHSKPPPPPPPPNLQPGSAIVRTGFVFAMKVT